MNPVIKRMIEDHLLGKSNLFGTPCVFKQPPLQKVEELEAYTRRTLAGEFERLGIEVEIQMLSMVLGEHQVESITVHYRDSQDYVILKVNI